MSNKKIIIIPNGTTEIPDDFLFNNKEVEEVIIPDSVISIGRNAFKGCSNLKRVRLSNNLKLCGAFCFANCNKLESIDLPKSLHYLCYGMFSGCKRLKHLGLHDSINFIEDYALYDCHDLEDFYIPENCTSLGIKSLYGLSKVYTLHIPNSLDYIGYGALGKIPNLSSFTCSDDHPVFLVDEGDTLFNKETHTLVRYAPNADKCEYLVAYVEGDKFYFGNETEPIPNYLETYNIGDYAFDGAKKLKKIEVLSFCEKYGPNTFRGCDNLKELKLTCNNSYSEFFAFDCIKHSKQKIHGNFETIIIGEGVKTIDSTLKELFKNAKKVVLPHSLKVIRENIFEDCSKLKNLIVQPEIQSIAPYVFNDNTTVYIGDFPPFKGRDFVTMQTIITDRWNEASKVVEPTKLICYRDNRVHIKIHSVEPVLVNIDELNNKYSNLNYENDDLYYDICDLVGWDTPNGLLTAFNYFENDDLRKKLGGLIGTLKDATNYAEDYKIRKVYSLINDKDKYKGLLLRDDILKYSSYTQLQSIISNYNSSLDRIFRYGDIPSPLTSNIPNSSDIFYTFGVDRLIPYSLLLEKYKVYDKFLYSPYLSTCFSLSALEDILKHYNRNLKRVIKGSEILNTNNFKSPNFADFYKLCSILGVFSDDEKTSQRACTFLCDKVFSEADAKGRDNYRIVGDKIHSIFESLELRDEYDSKFSEFFMNNYEELYELEFSNPGIISRIYNCFEEIKDATRRDSGNQNLKKVTIDKIKQFFLIDKFTNVDIPNRKLVCLLAKYYDKESILYKGYQIYLESLKAPRNIFDPYKIDNEGNRKFSKKNTKDLKGSLNKSFSYEWLPKQDLSNLILGKKCSCCAHVNGNGAGIMRASMTNDSCQNLVIKYKGEIFAKSTVYVNREKGYAIFNTIEANYPTTSDEFLRQTVDTLMLGVKAFVSEYNKNNPNNNISYVTVGTNRNQLADLIEENDTLSNKSIDYSKYSYYIDGNLHGSYSGDSDLGQKVLYKKKREN